MKKKLCVLLLGVCLVISFVLIKGCTKITEAEKPIVQASSANVDKLRKWFNDSWRPLSNARTSPWLHDTSFIVNNYSNIIPQWHLANTYIQGSVTYTEVPVILPDTLQFKIGTHDSAQLLSLFTDSIYTNLPQSKIFWIAKEEPGQDPYAEIVTFISDYEYAKADYQRFINGVSHFDITGYTGMVMYHDRNGQLLRVFQYVRGDLLNTIRCGTEGGLDPAPGNRVHLDACYEILTWERDCVTTYFQDGTSIKDCSEWILVGTHMVGNCFSNTGGGGGSGSSTAYYSPLSENGMDCGSFEFKKTTTANWQEAGLTDVVIRTIWFGTNPNTVGIKINFTLHSPIVFGLPIQRLSGEYYSPARAAKIAAQASDRALWAINDWVMYQPEMPPNAIIEKKYRDILHDLMKNWGGTAGRTGSGSPNIVYKKASYALLGNGKCY